MPYINSHDGRRQALKNGEPAQTAGELNYQIFYNIKHKKLETYEQVKPLVDQFLGINPNYQKYNDMTGALIRCYREIYRRLGYDCRFLLMILNDYDDEIAKYEDIKIEQNGDVE